MIKILSESKEQTILGGMKIPLPSRIHIINDTGDGRRTADPGQTREFRSPSPRKWARMLSKGWPPFLFLFLQNWTEKLEMQFPPWVRPFLDIFRQKSSYKKFLEQGCYSMQENWIELDKIEEERRTTFNVYYIFLMMNEFVKT